MPSLDTRLCRLGLATETSIEKFKGIVTNIKPNIFFFRTQNVMIVV